MSKWEKLINKLYRLSSELRFEELEKILIEYGYRMETPKGGSSHCTFRKQGRTPITIPKHKKIKSVYIRLVKDAVEKENEHEHAKDN